MTDKPTPTDAELKAMWQIHAADIGGIFYYARAVLAKWGTPATGGEPAGTVGYTVHGTQYVNWRTKPPAHGTPLYTTPQPPQAQAGAVPLDEARRLFDAGWKAAALFCDREDVVADGSTGFGACPQFMAAFSAAQPVAREPLTVDEVEQLIAQWSYELHGDRARYLVRMTEQHHGIKGGQHGTE